MTTFATKFYRSFFLAAAILFAFCIFFASAVFTQDMAENPPESSRAESNDLFGNTREMLRLWQPEQNCRLIMQADAVEVTAVSGEPIFFRRFENPCGQVTAQFRFRTRTESTAIVQWVTRLSPRRNNEQRLEIPLIADGQWHTYNVAMPIYGVLYGVSVQLTATSGMWEFSTGSLKSAVEPPLWLVRAAPVADTIDGVTDALAKVRMTLMNIAPVTVEFFPEGGTKSIMLLPDKSVAMQLPTKRIGCLRKGTLTLNPQGFDSMTQNVFFYDDSSVTDWISVPIGSGDTVFGTLEISADGTAARIRRGTVAETGTETVAETVAVLAPLATINGNLCEFSAPELETSEENGKKIYLLTLRSPQIILTLRVCDELIEVSISAESAEDELELVCGPRLRVFGELTSGLLAGIESLASGDVSSSPLDIEPPKNRRRQPKPIWITMPLSVLASQKVAVAVLWDDVTAQPTFSAPDYVEEIAGNAFSLASNNVHRVPLTMTLRVCATPPDPIADSVLWGIRTRNLPDVAPFPRAWETQRVLCLTSFKKLMGRDEMSWSYSTDPASPKLPYADVLSMLWRLSGVVPLFAAIEPGGGEIGNESIYFVSGRVGEWKTMHETLANSLVPELRGDGTFLYRSRFPELESTAASAIGYDALRLVQLMDRVETIGDKELFARVERGLENLAKSPIPRGGFYRDTTVHTPDLLSAAMLTHLFTRAYQFSAKDEYLKTAVRFALHGLPFVYQRKDEFSPNYATVPMLGATGRKNPVWFGMFRPQTGLVYAHALLHLGECDTTLDWKRIACGIVAAVEAKQWVDGPNVGCVPEFVEVETGRLSVAGISPVDVAHMRMLCENFPVELSLLSNSRERIIGPYPMRFAERGIDVGSVPTGQKFQILLQGRDVLDGIGSGSGRDFIKLD